MLSIFGAVWFTDPDTLMPLVREWMILGGVLAFSPREARNHPLATRVRGTTTPPRSGHESFLVTASPR
ncbi:hypothetical protein [Actinoalloteichus spitiensis]|uniref:hypothetical protein n=1 Tax=Actinoalloteichus spitiensis TaxID=252394 RepID=UPI001B7FB306|nr:hypothetical protein [Actinoalloteichus spitiensis]